METLMEADLLTQFFNLDIQDVHDSGSYKPEQWSGVQTDRKPLVVVMDVSVCP